MPAGCRPWRAPGAAAPPPCVVVQGRGDGAAGPWVLRGGQAAGRGAEWAPVRCEHGDDLAAQTTHTPCCQSSPAEHNHVQALRQLLLLRHRVVVQVQLDHMVCGAGRGKVEVGAVGQPEGKGLVLGSHCCSYAPVPLVGSAYVNFDSTPYV